MPYLMQITVVKSWVYLYIYIFAIFVLCFSFDQAGTDCIIA